MCKKFATTAAVMILAVFCLRPSALAAPVEIGAQELKTIMSSADALVIFPLSPIEFDNLHIPGSVNIPLEELKGGLPADKERRLAFYCLGRTCTAAPSAAAVANELGHKNVFVFREGLPGWIAAGFPVETTVKLPEAEIPTLAIADLKKMLESQDDFVLLDIRSQIDRKVWIDDPRCRELDLNTMARRWQEVPAGKKVVIIDYTGKRTQTAGRYLASKGFTDVAKVSGGILQWLKEGYPVRQVQ